MKEISLLTNNYQIKDIHDLYNIEIGLKSHFLYRIIDELKSEKSKSLIIWGTYANALKCARYLKKEYNINVNACVVNKKYMDLSINQVSACNELPFSSIEDYLAHNENVDIIIDFSFFKKELVKGYEHKINRIFVSDIMGAFFVDFPYVITRDMLIKSRDRIEEVYDLLEDDSSKIEYLDFISQKIWGFYNKNYHTNQYFDNEVVSLSSEEVFVDCGAYDGDSIEAFKKNVVDFKKIYAFEMDEKNFQKLSKNVGNDDKCVLIQKALGKERTKLKASTGENTSSHLDEQGKTEIDVDTIDNQIKEKVTMIKMDIEGYELDALIGARKTIETYGPKLAICMYHKFEDLWEIPLLIKEINPNYKVYFRNYHNSASESLLYALL